MTLCWISSMTILDLDRHLKVQDLSEEEFMDLYFPEGLTMSEEEYETLFYLSKSFCLITGSKGSGKNTSAYSLAWKMKYLFDLPVVSDARLRPAFGAYHGISLHQFIATLQGVSQAAEADLSNPEEAAFVLETTAKRAGFSLFNSIIIFDEVYKYLDCRTPHDRVVRIFGYWISQVRHYNSCLILISPHDDMIDRRVRRQVDFLGTCYSTKRSPICVCQLTELEEAKTLRLTLEKSKWGTLFYSDNVVGIRASTLDMEKRRL